MIRPLLLTLTLALGCATPVCHVDPTEGCEIIMGEPGWTSEVVCDD